MDTMTAVQLFHRLSRTGIHLVQFFLLLFSPILFSQSGRVDRLRPDAASREQTVSPSSRTALNRKSAAPTTGEEKFPIGQKAPGIVFADMNGAFLSPRTFAGKVVVLNFWFVNCPPCLKEMPSLNKLAASYAENDTVLFIAPTFDSRAAVASFLRSHDFAYDVAPDAQEVIRLFGIDSYPTHIVLDRQGRFSFVQLEIGDGDIMDEILDKAIRAALAR